MTRRLGFATLGCPGAAVDEIADLVLASGARVVELRTADDEPVHAGMEAAAAAKIGERLAAAGAEALWLSGYVELSRPDDGSLAAVLALAAAVGARGVRVFMHDPDPDAGDGLTDGERNAIATLRAVAGHPGTVLVETHDSHSSARRMARFFSALDAEVPEHSARVLWDTAHTWASGESLAESARLLEPWLSHLQVKDVATRSDPVPVALGAGSFPVAELAAALGQLPVDVSLEWERRWHPELPPLAEALAAVDAWAAPLLHPVH